MNFISGFFAQDVKMGALPVLRAATENDLNGGEYFSPDGFLGLGGYPVKTSSSKLSKDEKIAGKL